jgi:hypothetical protein
LSQFTLIKCGALSSSRSISFSASPLPRALPHHSHWTNHSHLPPLLDSHITSQILSHLQKANSSQHLFCLIKQQTANTAFSFQKKKKKTKQRTRNQPENLKPTSQLIRCHHSLSWVNHTRPRLHMPKSSHPCRLQTKVRTPFCHGYLSSPTQYHPTLNASDVFSICIYGTNLSLMDSVTPPSQTYKKYQKIRPSLIQSFFLTEFLFTAFI